MKNIFGKNGTISSILSGAAESFGATDHGKKGSMEPRIKNLRKESLLKSIHIFEESQIRN